MERLIHDLPVITGPQWAGVNYFAPRAPAGRASRRTIPSTWGCARAIVPKRWPRIAAGCAPRCRPSPCGCARYTATRWSTPTPARRMNPPPMPASRPRPGACWPSWLPIACPWSSPTRTAPCWARRTPAGAALPAACWKTPCAPCRPRCRTRAAGAPGSGPASGRRHSRWGRCAASLCGRRPRGRGPVRAAPGPAGQMAGRPARTGAAALAARWRTGAILRFVHGAGLAIFSYRRDRETGRMALLAWLDAR